MIVGFLKFYFLRIFFEINSFEPEYIIIQSIREARNPILNHSTKNKITSNVTIPYLILDNFFSSSVFSW